MLRKGPSSFARAIERVGGLLADPGKAKLAARATVTRQDLDVVRRVEALAAEGFPEIGVAPLRSGAEARLQEEDWGAYLENLVAASRVELERLNRNLPIRLTNLVVALRQLHRGACSPYPCGAGGGYFSVAASGRWYACHRAIGDPAFELGSNSGLNDGKRRAFLQARHVHAQTDCRTCWARYLCSGGCHQEAHARSAASCASKTGW